MINQFLENLNRLSILIAAPISFTCSYQQTPLLTLSVLQVFVNSLELKRIGDKSLYIVPYADLLAL